MKLVVLSHKPCWRSSDSPSGFSTDGGFPLQMAAIAELFDSAEILVPCRDVPEGFACGQPLTGPNLKIVPLTQSRGRGVLAKLYFPLWLARNSVRIVRVVWNADAVHAPIPGDVGTIGMLLALLLRKPLFVRHCGNWRVQRSTAERVWKMLMERFAGGRNVMLTTGGDGQAPSQKNPNIKWVFSTSLSEEELKSTSPRTHCPDPSSPRLVIACRQVAEKGTSKVIQALPELIRDYPGVRLEVIGSGPYLATLQALAKELQVGQHVTFTGQIPQPQVLSAFENADLFCYPTSASEGFPKAVVEALSAGLPVVTTRVSVLPQLIASRAGVLLDDDSPRSVANGVRKCLTDGRLYLQMSQAAIAAASTLSLERWRDMIGTELRSAWGPLRNHV